MKYQLRSTRYFYGPKTSKSIVQDEGNGPLVLQSRKEALQWIKEQDDGIYYLAHNEYARPTYTLVPIR
jgi:hypothetical protein